MSINIEVAPDGLSRTVSDDYNPRIHYREYRCARCGDWVVEDETYWFDSEGQPNTNTGKPYHSGCEPEVK